MEAKWVIFWFGNFCITVSLNGLSRVGNVKGQRPIFSINSEENALMMNIRAGGETLLSGVLGVSIPNAVGMLSLCPQTDYKECYRYHDYARVEINETGDGCSYIMWTSTYAKKFEDCYDLREGHHWYGGGETYVQRWPIEIVNRTEAPFVNGDFLQGQPYGSLVENYWLISTGIAIRVDDDVPLFMSWSGGDTNRVCFVAKSENPYPLQEQLRLSYHICLGKNVKDVHLSQIEKGVIPKPIVPDVLMLMYPIWSTWVQFKEKVNEKGVIKFADEIINHGFNASQIEIDDNWETCYGEFKFNPKKFPNPKGMVEHLKSLKMRTTLWIHPFINYECPIFAEALENGYFVKGAKGQAGLTKWWRGENAGIVDFTNQKAVDWWIERLRNLKDATGIHGFKFDAGESSYLPVSPILGSENPITFSTAYTTAYIEAVATLGGPIEVRSGRKTQHLPVFTRILDRESKWGYDNGLRSLIPTVLHFSTVGYPFVLPDMIGGNGFNGAKPSKELFIRWMQVTAFMPAFQFSLPPWNYNDTQVVKIAADLLKLRLSFIFKFDNIMKEAVNNGIPINRPLWWHDPTGEVALSIDSEFLFGDSVLVAPVLEEGAVTRDIYLPIGTWTAHDGEVFEGPRWIRDYPAPLETLPYFITGNLELHEFTNELPLN